MNPQNIPSMQPPRSEPPVNSQSDWHSPDNILSATTLPKQHSSKYFNPAYVHDYIQAGFACFYVYIGFEFYKFYLWATGLSVTPAVKPPSVEAFLPISAFMAARRFFAYWEWDNIHPAGLTIFFIAVLVALLARKGFCGYFCPVGFAVRMLDRLGRKLKISRRPHKYISWFLTIPKYILLGLSLKLFLFGMPTSAIEGFLNSPYNIVADIKMLLLFLEPSTTTIIAMFVIMAGSMLVPGFWCRGLCPYGAFLGLFSFFSPVAVQRDKNSCTHCGRCAKRCPTRIPVHQSGRIYSPECQGCLECVAACPEEGCLSVKFGYTKNAPSIPNIAVPLLCLFILLMCYVAALSSSNWVSNVPDDMYKVFWRFMNQ